MKQINDLNQMYYFAQVVHYQGFSAASRELGIPKSRLSRQVAQLEEHLQVRLIQRNTRHFYLTEIGHRYYQHCQAMLIEAEAAQAAIESAHFEPTGTIRVSCPVTLLQIHIAPLIFNFMQQYPKITVELEASNRAVDVIGEGFDIAIRARTRLESEDLVAKILSNRHKVLVANTEWLRQQAPLTHPQELVGLPSLGLGKPNQTFMWTFQHPIHGAWEQIHFPRLITTEMTTLLQAAVNGLGLVELPHLVVEQHLATQELTMVLPEWLLPIDIIHAVYPSRRGQLLAVKTFLNFLETFYKQDQEATKSQ